MGYCLSIPEPQPDVTGGGRGRVILSTTPAYAPGTTGVMIEVANRWLLLVLLLPRGTIRG